MTGSQSCVACVVEINAPAIEHRESMVNNINDRTRLNNGLKMHWVGPAVFQMKDDDEVEDAVRHSLKVGYRSVDTAG
jgi:hypothetical protein